MGVRVNVVASMRLRATNWRAAGETILIIGGLAANLILLPHHLSGDAQLRFQELSQLLRTHTFSAARFSLVGPLFATPLWLLGQVNQSAEWWCLRYNTLLLAGGMLVFYLLLRNQLDRSLLRSFFLLLVFASMLTQQLTDFDAEIFTALLVMIGALLVTQWRGKIGWPMIILGAANVPASLAGLVLMALTRIWNTRYVRYLIVPAIAAALIGIEDWLRRGNPLDSGYHGFNGNLGFRTMMPYSGMPGFSYPIFFGLLSIFLSFGKGLIFYMPGLVLPVRRRLLETISGGRQIFAAYQLWIAFLVGLILVYSRWWAWYGGWYWGPRFFLFGSLVACFALSLVLRYPSRLLMPNLVYLVILMLTFWVGIDGALFGQNTLAPVCTANDYALEAFCHYVPEFSALWRPFVVYEPLAPKQILYLTLSALTFIYVSLPLLRSIVRQGRIQLSRLRWSAFSQAWHF